MQCDPSISPYTHLAAALCAAALCLCSLGAAESAAMPPASATSATEAGAPNEQHLYALRFSAPGLLERMAQDPAAQLRSAPSPRAWIRSAAGRARQQELRQLLLHELEENRASVSQLVGREVQPELHFLATRPGFAALLSSGEAQAVLRHPDIVSLRAERWLPGVTENGPAWIGAPAVWDGTATGAATQGEGVVVGIIDSGVLFGHPSFSDAPDDGHEFTNPYGSGSFAGWCDPGHPNFDPGYTCNDKLIGAWDYMDAICAMPGSNCSESDGPNDNDGHGTHVASIAAGNAVLLNGSNVEITGVAPHANLVSYDVCTLNDSFQPICSFVGIQAAIDQAMLDGVDVLNMSILGGSDPWNDDDRDFLDAVDAGIFVTTGAGNDGPDAGTVAHLGPWLSSVGATTHDRESYSGVVSFSGGPSALGPFPGGTLNQSGFGPQTVVYAGDYGAMDDTARACGDTFPSVLPNPFPPGTWTSDEIVVCELRIGTASSPPTFKSQNLADAGAGGMILLADPIMAREDISSAFPNAIPSMTLLFDDSAALRTWLASGTGHEATLSAGARIDAAGNADRVLDFSSRGPNASFDVLKPDVSAPGSAIRNTPTLDESGILAAEAARLQPPFSGVLVAYRGGTSMASPHVAGGAALLRALHPSWSPDQIRAALATTALNQGLVSEDGATPMTDFDFGSGRIDLAAAARATLLLEETTANYLAADPDSGGQPRTLNVASLMSSACAGSCSFERTFENVGASSTSWQVSLAGEPLGLEILAQPNQFTLAPGATISVALTLFNTEPSLVGDWQHAAVHFEPDDNALPDTHLALALLPTAVTSTAIFSDGFESGNTSSWNSSAP